MTGAGAAARLRVAVDEAWSALDNEPALLPDALASAAREFLASDGASLSMVAAELRVPLGASDPVSSMAERLQFTSGDGPCMQALRDGVATRTSTSDLESRWPLLADSWAARTPFRSTASLPVPIDGELNVVLNLFYADADGGAALDPTAAAAVVLELRRRLTELDSTAGDGEPEPAWLSSEPAVRRQRVWVALGVVVLATGLGAPDALARLRSRAVAQSQSLDEVAERIVEDPGAAADLMP